MILILSDIHDVHANVLASQLESESLPFFRLNLDVESLRNTHLVFKKGVWEINQGGNQLYSTNVLCVWARTFFVKLLLEEEDNDTTDFKIWKNEWNRTLLGFYLSIKNIPWLNPIQKAYQAENKFLQLQLAESLKLNIPETIVSNNKQKLISFAKENGSVALKIMEQNFYKDSEGKLMGLYVNKIEAQTLEEFKEYDENPVTLQAYIEKKFEVRYTVVGNKHLVCKIDSQKSLSTKTDWRRYDIPKTPHLEIVAPKDIQEKVTTLMDLLELNYGALDFIVDQNDKWYFLEVNSMGQYLWIEDLTGIPITSAIVNWLRNHLK